MIKIGFRNEYDHRRCEAYRIRIKRPTINDQKQLKAFGFFLKNTLTKFHNFLQKVNLVQNALKRTLGRIIKMTQKRLYFSLIFLFFFKFILILQEFSKCFDSLESNSLFYKLELTYIITEIKS